MIDESAIRIRYEALGAGLDERGRRLFAAAEARAAGVGGVSAVARATVVDGGLNPRIFGGGAKIGTNFAVDFSAAKRWDDRPLSTPQAAGGGGRRPAFTEVYRPTKIIR